MGKQENIRLFMEKNKIPPSNCVLTGSRWHLLPKKATLLDHMLHVGVFRGVQFDVIFSQDLHDGPDFQPPLCLRDAAPATDGRDHSLTCYCTYILTTCELENIYHTQNLCLPSIQREVGR